MSELEIINNHIHDRLKSIQFLLDLSAEVSLPQSKIKKLGHEVLALSGLLEEFEALVGRQRDQLKELKVLEKMFQRDAEEIQYLRDNMPTHMPRSKSTLSGGEAALKQPEAVERLPPQTGNHKAVNKTFIVEMEVLTTAEFDSIPQYMKGRVSYDQLNAVVGSVNTAVLAKYKIVHQPLKTLNDRSRKLLRRFKDQETKDTKGQYFFVEDDIREFTQMKVDKRFQGILNMLRHCQRLRELRGGGLTRYILL